MYLLRESQVARNSCQKKGVSTITDWQEIEWQPELLAKEMVAT